MYKDKKLLIGIVIFGIVGVILYRQFHNRAGKASDPEEFELPQLEQGHDYFKEKMESEYKKRALAGPIAMQEQVVKQLPDNTEAKRRLAKLYLEAGDKEKAKPLLESMIQAGDAEAKELYKLIP